MHTEKRIESKIGIKRLMNVKGPKYLQEFGKMIGRRIVKHGEVNPETLYNAALRARYEAETGKNGMYDCPSEYTLPKKYTQEAFEQIPNIVSNAFREHPWFGKKIDAMHEEFQKEIEEGSSSIEERVSGLYQSYKELS